MSSYSSLNPDEFSPPEYTDLSVSRIYIDPLGKALMDSIKLLEPLMIQVRLMGLIYDTLTKIEIDKILNELLSENAITHEMIHEAIKLSIFVNSLLHARKVYVDRILLSAYIPDEFTTEKEEWHFYIEFEVELKDVDELIKVWDELLECIKVMLGEDILEKIDIFLTRARHAFQS